MSYLVNPYMVSPATVPMTIPSIGNEYWHYDFAGEQSTITMDGSNRVSKVTDGFGTASRDISSSGGDQPLFIANDTNGLGVLEFAGDCYMMSGTQVPATLIQPFTVFSVQQFLTGGGGNQEGLTVDGNVIANRLNHCNHYQVDGVMLNCGANLGCSSGAPDNENHLITSVVNGGSSDNRVDGSSCITGNAGGSNWDGVTIGANSQHLSVFWNAKIMEVATFSTNVSGSDLTDVENYFLERWGIT